MKHNTLLHLLGEHHEVSVYLDPRHPDVEVPERFKRLTNVHLIYGYALVPSIDPLVIDDAGISAILSFSGVKEYTFVPWAAVFAIGPSGYASGFVFPESLPKDIAEPTDLRSVPPDTGWLCVHCGRPATCIGAYENAQIEEPACDVCCGHANEDGHCRQIEGAAPTKIFPKLRLVN